MSYDALRKGRYSEAGRAYFVTTATAGRVPHFRELGIGRLVVAELRSLHEQGIVQSLAWVLMPDHLHWLFQLGAKLDLAGVMKRFKAQSALRVNAALGRSGTIWQRAYYDHAIRDNEDVREIARYIVANSVRNGLVQSVGDYPLWDAVWL